MSARPDARWLDPQDAGTRARWAELAEGAEPSAFGPPAVSEAVAGAFGLRLRLLAVEADGDLAAALAVYEKRRGPYRLAVVPPLVAETPILLREPLGGEARRPEIAALAEALAAEYPAAALRLPVGWTDARPFQWAGFQATPRYTYAGPLLPPDDALARAGRGVRQRVRRDGPAVTHAEAPDALDALLALDAAGAARRGDAETATPAMRTGLASLLDAGAARLFALRDETGEIVGAQALVTDGRAAAVVLGASRPGPAMTVMTMALQEALYADGLVSLDLVGANLPGVAEFKRAFGLPLAVQYRVTRLARPELRALSLVRPVV